MKARSPGDGGGDPQLYETVPGGEAPKEEKPVPADGWRFLRIDRRFESCGTGIMCVLY
uniref:Uncharacterized protein n=1 Tax=Meloidogyne incognita TaxID=6306 RepID=A0A914MIV6_MELIC